MPAAKGAIPWNAGTSQGWTDKRGYRWLYVTENGRRRARREHRVIVERHLGRRLEPWEVVHHKDAFALLREELKAERAIKSELLEALQRMLEQFTRTPSTLKDSDARCKAHAAIAKATGDQA